ncbi:MAG: DegT/DnrJ/EryC1/StrS family aminotransferase [Acidobacteriia bacterium]|nr:DegT/DnrJ/EryC1/StrS family aminotransferase [Terriglobia bacterium]
MNRKLDFWIPQFGADEKALVADVLDSSFLNDGEVTTQFERQTAELLGCRHVVATTSGTTAIFLALAGIGVGAGDEVLVPDVTFIATANAVTLAGAKPVLVDVDPQKLTIDPQCIERAITPRTKAIVPVHVSGRAADMGGILDIAKRHGLLVVEDAAEAFLSKHEGKALGTFGVAGCYSLSPNKTITTGQGGLIATDDDRLHVRLRELKDQGRPERGSGGDDAHNSIGYNFKFTNLQAAVGLGQLRDLSRRLERMRDIYRGYAEGLRGVRGVSVLPFCIEGGEVPQWTDVFVERRDALYDQLVARRICGRRFWHPLHTQAPYRASDELFPNSTKLVPHAMWLPSAFTLSDADVTAVCGEIQEILA